MELLRRTKGLKYNSWNKNNSWQQIGDGRRENGTKMIFEEMIAENVQN